eukprot:3515330-Amphidinium_carterae.2
MEPEVIAGSTKLLTWACEDYGERKFLGPNDLSCDSCRVSWSMEKKRDSLPPGVKRRSDALHPHLDSEPEEYEDDNDSQGTYLSPTLTNETPELEEDLTWEEEDLEEESRERDEVVSASPEPARMRPPYAWAAPPVITKRPLPKAAVRQLPRPLVIDPRPPTWEEPTAEEQGEETDPNAESTEDYTWLWDHEPGQRAAQPKSKAKGAARGRAKGRGKNSPAKAVNDDDNLAGEHEREFIPYQSDEELGRPELEHVPEEDDDNVPNPQDMNDAGGGGGVAAKDAVHEVEWDGARWVAIHHASTRQDTFKVSKLQGTWNIAQAAPVSVDGCSTNGEFNMSYTVDTDPHSIGMDWWGTTYVKIDGKRANTPVSTAVIPSREAYALVDSGASHVLMPLSELSARERASARDISVNLAVGKRQAKVWRHEIYAEGTKVSRLLPIGRILDKLALTVNGLRWSPSRLTT